MPRTLRSLEDAVAWHERYGPNAPVEGDEAPDFELGDATGKEKVRLSDFRGLRPVVLVFGSFT